jgi:hypothetical protein
MRPLRSCLQSEYIGEELGGCPFVSGWNDRVIELDGHFLLLLVPSKMIAGGGCSKPSWRKGARDFSETISVADD